MFRPVRKAPLLLTALSAAMPTASPAFGPMPFFSHDGKPLLRYCDNHPFETPFDPDVERMMIADLRDSIGLLEEELKDFVAGLARGDLPVSVANHLTKRRLQLEDEIAKEQARLDAMELHLLRCELKLGDRL
jgi:hypothetical protein